MDDNIKLENAMKEFISDYGYSMSTFEIIYKLMCYGFVELGYLDLVDLPWENDD